MEEAIGEIALPDPTRGYAGLAGATVAQFLTDVLGSLVPGILFTVGGALTAATLCALLFGRALLGGVVNGPNGTSAGAATGGAVDVTVFVRNGTLLPHDIAAGLVAESATVSGFLWVFAALLFLVLAYVTGQTFFRRDPKVPDRVGFNRIVGSQRKNKLARSGGWGRFDDEGNRRHRFARVAVYPVQWISTVIRHSIPDLMRDVGEDDMGLSESEYVRKAFRLKEPDDVRADVVALHQELACARVSDCEFPYPYLSTYLRARGLDHLLKYVTWDGPSSRRSKVVINALKLRIETRFPVQYRRIMRNEAHVRLSTSSWYACTSFRRITESALAILVFVLLGDLAFGWERLGLPDWGAALSLAWFAEGFAVIYVLHVFSSFIKQSIETSIHYQRLREVVYVLETAAILAVPPVHASSDGVPAAMLD